jgi:gamma-glutamyltranspeptidase
MSQKKDSNVSVGVRIRPRNDKEIAANMQVFFSPTPDGGSVQELDDNGTAVKHWSYDRVFGPESSNKEVFDTMGSKLVDGALEGYNTVMFMYGQTSSGNLLNSLQVLMNSYVLQ